MTYITPETLADALASIRMPSKVVAGCTDFFPSLESERKPDRIVDITRVHEMSGICQQDGGWRIGATSTWSEILDTPFPKAFDGLKAAAREVGSVQIQNAGTIAGNICNASPAADGVPPLLTLEAKVEIASANSTRMLDLTDFILGPRKIRLLSNELVTAIWIPGIVDSTTSSFLKLGSRKYLVISIAMVGVVCSVSTAGIIEFMRIAIGACSPVAKRLYALEKSLVGIQANKIFQDFPISSRDLDILTPIYDVRATIKYREDAALELCKRAVKQALLEGMPKTK